MNKLICIIGETASGKDTAARYLMSKYHLQPVISYTTRPQRPTETQGKEHYFITNDEANKILKTEKIVAYTEIGEYKYFATENELNVADFYIIDPDGLKMLKQHYPHWIITTIYITTTIDKQKQRFIERGGSLQDFQARYEAEQRRFYEFTTQHKYNYKCVNKSDLKVFYRKLNSIIIDIQASHKFGNLLGW